MGITQVLVVSWRVKMRMRWKYSEIFQLVGSVMWVKTVYQMAYPNGFK